MLFHVYGSDAIPQWIAMLGVLAALILLNEFARRTKAGGILMFVAVPAVLTVYFIVVAVGAGKPDLYLHERLVSLCKAVRVPGGLYRLYDDQIWMGHWKVTLV